jgi:hypothetical protein
MEDITIELMSTGKNPKKKTCLYCGNIVHVDKNHWKKGSDLEEKVKKLGGDMSVVH